MRKLNFHIFNKIDTQVHIRHLWYYKHCNNSIVTLVCINLLDYTAMQQWTCFHKCLRTLHVHCKFDIEIVYIFKRERACFNTKQLQHTNWGSLYLQKMNHYCSFPFPDRATIHERKTWNISSLPSFFVYPFSFHLFSCIFKNFLFLFFFLFIFHFVPVFVPFLFCSAQIRECKKGIYMYHKHFNNSIVTLVCMNLLDYTAMQQWTCFHKCLRTLHVHCKFDIEIVYIFKRGHACFNTKQFQHTNWGSLYLPKMVCSFPFPDWATIHERKTWNISSLPSFFVYPFSFHLFSCIFKTSLFLSFSLFIFHFVRIFVPFLFCSARIREGK